MDGTTVGHTHLPELALKRRKGKLGPWGTLSPSKMEWTLSLLKFQRGKGSRVQGLGDLR